MTNTAEKMTQNINGINTNRIVELATSMSSDDNFGKFRFRADNQWLNGSRSRTSIQTFFAGNNERNERQDALILHADQPAFLAGENTAPNAVEHYLNSLVSCLNTTVVAHASAQGIPIEALDISAEGEMDARGFFGVSDEINRGYNKISVDIRAKMPVNHEKLRSLMSYSPVYEMVSRSIPVEVNIIITS